MGGLVLCIHEFLTLSLRAPDFQLMTLTLNRLHPQIMAYCLVKNEEDLLDGLAVNVETIILIFGFNDPEL